MLFSPWMALIATSHFLEAFETNYLHLLCTTQCAQQLYAITKVAKAPYSLFDYSVVLIRTRNCANSIKPVLGDSHISARGFGSAKSIA